MRQRGDIRLFSPEWYMTFFVAAIWAYQPLIMNVGVYASKYVGVIFDVFLYVLMAIAFFMSRAVWQKKIKAIDMAFYLVCVAVTLFSITVSPQSAEPIKDLIVPFLLQVLTYYFVGLLIDIEKQKQYIYWVSALSVFFQFLYFFFFLQRLVGDVDLRGDLIVPATYTLPHILVIVWHTLKKPNLLNIALTIASAVLLVSFSNRGSILAVILFVVTYFFFLTPKKNNVGIRALLVIAAALFIFFFNQISDALFGFIQSYGMSSSLFDRLNSGEITDSNGRDFIYNSAMNYIYNAGVFGGGMGVDRVVLGTYAHNLVIELIMDFGILMGGILVVSLFVLIIKSFFKSQSFEVKVFIAVLCGRGLIHMLISGSYIEDGHFFLLIGFCVAALRQSKMRPQIQQANG